MASKTTLNAKNLETLGAAALAQLLIEVSTGNAAAKRRLRLALAGGQGAHEAAAVIRKRLISIGNSRSRITWKNRKALVTDLQAQLVAITDQVAPQDAEAAADLLWRFITLADPLLARGEDSGGAFFALFQTAIAQLGRLAETAGLSPAGLVDGLLPALLENRHGQNDGLIAALAPALGADGLDLLKIRITALAETPAQTRRGASHGPEAANRAAIATALKQLADAQGDVDGFMAQYPADSRRIPAIAAEIAGRMLAAHRPAEALALLDAASPASRMPAAWQDARILALDTLGQTAAAQAFRWGCFTRGLQAPYLRDHLKRLPDFDDIEAEEAAMAFAAAYPHALLALHFLVAWPALRHAEALVLARHAELDGDQHDILTTAAQALADRHPLAAALLLRRMIGFALGTGRAAHHAQAAVHLQGCAALDSRIADYGTAEPHGTFVAALQARHGRKAAFLAGLA